MNKHILIITGLLIAQQSFADIGATNGVPDPATCNSGVLDTESGGAALQAQYIPETISLQWYDNNTLLNVTSTSSDSCTYGTGINLPANPTKTGYKFTGWKVRPLYDFSTLPSYGGDRRWYKGINPSTGQEICGTDGIFASCDTENNYNDLKPQELKISFQYGMIYAMSLCSSTQGTTGNTGTPNETTQLNRGFCWCKVTRYIPLNENVKYAPLKSLPWVYSTGYNTCLEGYCSGVCANYLRNDQSFREKAFGISNN